MSAGSIIYQTILLYSFDTDDAQVVAQVETADVFCISVRRVRFGMYTASSPRKLLYIHTRSHFVLEA